MRAVEPSERTETAGTATDVAAHLQTERAYYDASVRHLAPLTRELTAAVVARIPPAECGAPVEHHRCVYYTARWAGRENGELRRYPRSTGAKTGAAAAAAEGAAAPGSGDSDRERDGDRAGDEMVLDIDALRGDSAYVDLGVVEVSPDETLLAYSVDITGEEVFELRFRDLASGADLPDRIARSYYGGAWSTAGDVFFYTVHDDSYRPFEVRRHLLGSDVSSDVVIFREDDEQFEVRVRACRSGGLIVVTAASRDTTEEWLVDPAAPSEPARLVEARRKGREYAVEHAPYDGVDRLLVVTNEGASEFRLAAAPLASPGLDNWTSVLPPDPEERLLSVDAFAGFVVVHLRRAGSSQLRLLRHDGSVVRDVDPPSAGHVELAENPRFDAASVVVSRGSYVEPQTWSALDVATGAERELHRAEVPGYDPSDYASEVVEVAARDGASVPVTLVHRRDVSLDGTAPCLMYGYGAYEAVDEPALDAALLALVDRGVVFAHAQVRGGGERGRRWWLDGRLEAKHHTFEDYIDVADTLADRYVDGTRIATRGLSAGGLLQGAVFSSRPDRWRAVVAEVPFVDVVTTMLDPTIPLTANEWDEWGDPRREADFAWMLAYSPYDNLPPAGGRPDLLVTGAVHDPRVMVSEPAKWVAALRHSDPEWRPHCVFRVDTGAGAHAGPSGRFARAAYEAEIYAWVLARIA